MSQHEAVKKRIRQFNVFSESLIHDLEKHKIYHHAVVDSFFTIGHQEEFHLLRFPGRLVSIIANLPQRIDLIRSINHVQNRHIPLNLQFLEDQEIVAPYTMTFSGEQFLQYDS